MKLKFKYFIDFQSRFAFLLVFRVFSRELFMHAKKKRFSINKKYFSYCSIVFKFF